MDTMLLSPQGNMKYWKNVFSYITTTALYESVRSNGKFSQYLVFSGLITIIVL